MKALTLILLAVFACGEFANAGPSGAWVQSKRDLESLNVQIQTEERAPDGTNNPPFDRFYTVTWTPDKDRFPKEFDRTITVVVYPVSDSRDPKDHEPILRSIFPADENGNVKAEFSFKEESEFHLVIYFGFTVHTFYRLKLQDYLDGFESSDAF